MQKKKLFFRPRWTMIKVIPKIELYWHCSNNNQSVWNAWSNKPTTLICWPSLTMCCGGLNTVFNEHEKWWVSKAAGEVLRPSYISFVGMIANSTTLASLFHTFMARFDQSNSTSTMYRAFSCSICSPLDSFVSSRPSCTVYSILMLQSIINQT